MHLIFSKLRTCLKVPWKSTGEGWPGKDPHGHWLLNGPLSPTLFRPMGMYGTGKGEAAGWLLLSSHLRALPGHCPALHISDSHTQHPGGEASLQTSPSCITHQEEGTVLRCELLSSKMSEGNDGLGGNSCDGLGGNGRCENTRCIFLPQAARAVFIIINPGPEDVSLFIYLFK